MIVNYRHWNIRMGSVGTVVRGLRKLLVIILNGFRLSVLLRKEQFNLVLLLVLLNKKQMNCSGFVCSVIIIRWLILGFGFALAKTESNWYLPILLVLFWFCSPALAYLWSFNFFWWIIGNSYVDSSIWLIFQCLLWIALLCWVFVICMSVM